MEIFQQAMIRFAAFMKVYRHLSEIPSFTKAVVTIGTFDGVHLGHRKIIEQLKKEAKNIGGETVLVSFHPHPRMVTRKDDKILLLNTLEEKIALLEQEGIDHLVIVPFTDAFANQSPESYIENFLVKYIRPHTLIIGYDHRFGQHRRGDYHLLEKMADRFGYKVMEISGHLLNEITVSSTRIRESLLNGNIELASALLGYKYFFEGVVIEGNKIGRTIGYPTANLKIQQEDKLIPANGVYAVKVKIKNSRFEKQTFTGMMNIGVRPTVGGGTRMIEVNIFDFDEEIYGETMQVTIQAYLRPEQKFNGLDMLKAQLALDKLNALKVLG
jgi:riboflavin kinase/FMN adenylyltransferase